MEQSVIVHYLTKFSDDFNFGRDNRPKCLQFSLRLLSNSRALSFFRRATLVEKLVEINKNLCYKVSSRRCICETSRVR